MTNMYRLAAKGLVSIVIMQFTMTVTHRKAFAPLLAATIVSSVVLSAGTEPQQPTTQDTPVFRTGVTLVTTDVIVRDGQGQFLPDLNIEDFVVYEDGQAQEIASLVLVHGGRVYNQLLPPAPVQEGIVLPSAAKQDTNTPGRIFVLFIDDLHLSVTDTPKVQRVLELLADTVIHDGDMFGIMSSGKSSIFVQMTRDRELLYDVIPRVVGEGLRVQDIVGNLTADPMRQENLFRATSAFKAAEQTVRNLEEITNRRKVFLYVSPGYDFDPFEEGQALAEVRAMVETGFFTDPVTGGDTRDFPELNDPTLREFGDRGAFDHNQFSDTNLNYELLRLTTAANRANVSFYTIDPRGLGSMPDLDYEIRVGDWNDYLRTQHSGLRLLAELTGGMAVVNRNTFEEAFKEIDAETSDYYILGFYSSNADATHKVRELSVEVNRPDTEIRSRTHYVISGQ